MKVLSVLLAISAASILSGCFFFYIPGSVTGAVHDSLTGSFGNMCVLEGVKVGDKVRLQGSATGTVIKVSNGSARCEAGRVRAEVTYD